MKAFVLAAGLGTRLYNYTSDRPKAMVEIGGYSEIQIVFEQLKRNGFTEAVVNVHHYAQKLIDYINSNKGFGLKVEFSDETDLLRDTGGGIKHAAKFFKDSDVILVHNVDILSNINIKALLDFHFKENALATLAVKNRPTSRSLLIDCENRLQAWTNNQTGAVKPENANISGLTPVAFSCVHAINPKIFNLVETESIFSIIDVYLQLCESEKIMTFNHDQDYWVDMGNIGNLPEAERILKTWNK